jgi:hypothetical protein
MSLIERSAAETSLHPRRLQAPRDDFSILADPPLAASIELGAENRRTLDPLTDRLQGRSVAQLRQWSRESVIVAARDYTRTILEAAGAATTDEAAGREIAARPLFVSGHQPSLFHPGVWLKNFAIAEMADRASGLALNLTVDTDLMVSTRIRVPAGDRGSPRVELCPFDADRPRRPWEECEIQDRACFESFGDRVDERMASWSIRPVLGDIWPDAVRASSRSGCCAIAWWPPARRANGCGGAAAWRFPSAVSASSNLTCGSPGTSWRSSRGSAKCTTRRSSNIGAPTGCAAGPIQSRS